MKILRNIKKWICRAFRVEYCLRVISAGQMEPPRYSTERRLMVGPIRALRNGEYWTLYKKGPFFMGERPVEWGQAPRKEEA
ncbi:MAG: hypothetical protein SPJ13_01260 [Bacteroidales bacterium]|nr:hypothetical protein [Bacteroidales bacterium]